MTRATTPADPWHYPRPELAAKYLQVFDVGLSSARALFAKRRMGKSEFLEQDLIPAARDAGYLTREPRRAQAKHQGHFCRQLRGDAATHVRPFHGAILQLGATRAI